MLKAKHLHASQYFSSKYLSIYALAALDPSMTYWYSAITVVYGHVGIILSKPGNAHLHRHHWYATFLPSISLKECQRQRERWPVKGQFAVCMQMTTSTNNSNLSSPSSAHAWFRQIQPSGKYRQDSTFALALWWDLSLHTSFQLFFLRVLYQPISYINYGWFSYEVLHGIA